ncbi:hypothetical protein BaRGS_00015041, partial [Batillaria attramentaria]
MRSGNEDNTVAPDVLIMKFVLLFALVAVAYAQFGGHLTLESLVQHEIHALVEADTAHALTQDSCVAKCDAEFAMLDAHDEQALDHLCARACE